MSTATISDDTTARIESALAAAAANPDTDAHELTVLRAARLAVRRRDKGLTYSAEAVEKALATIGDTRP